MKKVVRLTESDLTRIVKRVMNEAPITGQSGAISNLNAAKQANPAAGGGVGGSRPNPAAGGGVGGSRPNPAAGGGVGLKVNLVIDCKRRVILNNDVPLTLQGNSMVINAFCTPSYRKPTGGK